ncbi:hypothetical protein [Methylomicrobium agile]|uniref:hypothetical protein n=1 Tax=Methylomicrobium agile TaxID=39774 RepID=UPI003CCB83BC
MLAFCSAKPRDGGAGAVLVLLRLSENSPKETSCYFKRDPVGCAERSEAHKHSIFHCRVRCAYHRG